MRFVLHAPTPGSRKEQALACRIAEIHARAATEVMQDLACPKEQLGTLLDTALGRVNRTQR